MTYRMLIYPTDVDNVRSWFATRQGCVVWTNKEIGYSRPDLMTPKLQEDGSETRPPHWAYVGHPDPIKPEEIGIRTEKQIPLPKEWFPACERCQGSGRRSLKELADIRKETIDELLAHAPPIIQDVSVEKGTFNCNQCRGSGHEIKAPRIRLKREYWGGYTVKETTKIKMTKMASKLGTDILWDWNHCDSGFGEVFFYTEEIVPFSLP
jgi:hypothetical protein